MYDKQKFSDAYDRYQSGKATEADESIVAKRFIDHIKAAYPEINNDPTLMYRVGIELVNNSRPLIEKFLKNQNQKA